MHILFFGSGGFGLPTLQRLVRDHEVCAVVSQPDRPAGRRRTLTPTPVAAWAEGQGLTVLKSDDVNSPEFVEQIRSYEADASVVIAFGQKLGEPLIAAMGRLAVNLHGSLLPKYRGAAPIHRALMNGEAVTGVSVIGLAQRMDAGPIYGCSALAVDPDETTGELHDRLAMLGPEAVARVLEGLEQNTLSPTEQDEAAATSAPKLKKADGTVGFDQSPARVRGVVHGLSPWPGCRVVWRSAHHGGKSTLLLRRVAEVEDPEPTTCVPGTVLHDLSVACGEGAVRLVEVQLPGGKPMTFDAFVAGHRLAHGDSLSPVS